MIIVFCLFLWFILFGYSLNSQVSFLNHRLYNVNLNGNQSLIKLFNDLQKQIDIDFWTQPNLESSGFNFRVSPKFQQTLENVLTENKVIYKLLTDNLEKWIEQERFENFMNQSMSYSFNIFDVNNFKIDYYHNYYEINEYLNYLEEKYPNVSKVLNIGLTYEKHTITGIKLGIPRDDGQTKPAFWIDAGIHAREWITPATALYVIHKLAEKHKTDLDVRDLMIRYDWYIFPVLNPDGYVYSFQKNRMWRKNRALPKTRPFRFPWDLFNECIGIDLNRNFDVGFGGYGSSGNPCSEIFKGDASFSEKETQAVRDTITKLGSSLKVFLSLHAYSQMWMSPYSHTTLNTKDHQELFEILKRVSKAVLTVNGMSYRYGTMSSTIYPCGGTSVDWVYDKANVKYSFTAELRDSGIYGFLLPRTQILPTAQETWEGIKTLANEVKIEKKKSIT